MSKTKDPIASPEQDDTDPPETDILGKGSREFFAEPAETQQERKPPETSSEASNTAPKP